MNGFIKFPSDFPAILGVAVIAIAAVVIARNVPGLRTLV